jgi:hypothetical protein
MAQQLVRHGSISAGPASKIAIVDVNKGLVLTAVCDSKGNLKLIAWQVSDDPNEMVPGGKHIIRKGEASAGAISEVSLCNMGNNLVVTAVRDGSGLLKIIAWKISEDGLQIERRADISHDELKITKVNVKKMHDHLMTNHLAITAFRNGAGNLQLIAWEVSMDGNFITRKGEAFAGKVSRVDLVAPPTVPVPLTDSIVTAVRTAGGNLKLITWKVSFDALKIERKSEANAGKISEVALHGDYGVDGFTYGLVTAVRDGSQNLKLISWEVKKSSPNEIERVADASAGEISHVATTRVGGGGTSNLPQRHITAVRDGSGELKLIAWNVSLSSGIIEREGDASAGAISEIDICPVWGNFMVTAVRNGSGKLELIAWEHNGP